MSGIRLRLFFLTLSLLVLVSGAQAVSLKHVVSLKVDAPERYEVKRGDSLWSVASRFLNDPWMWPQLWQANQQVSNPHLLYPGDVLELLQQDGKPVLHLRPRLRIMTLQDPLPYMPLEQVNTYLNADIMIERPAFEDALYVVSLGEGRTLASRGDQLDVLGNLTQGVTRYNIHRELEEIRHPVTRKHLGYMARSIGTARLVSTAGRLPRFEILGSQEEIRIGDRLLPYVESPFDQASRPQPPARPLNGLLLRSLTAADQQLIGAYQPVMLDLGRNALQPGQLLEVLAPGRRLRDPQTGEVIFAAEQSRGLLVVYRTFDEVSFGLVLQASQPMHPGDVFRQARAL